MPTPLYHAQLIGGKAGLSFQIGASTLFAPFDEDVLYYVGPTHLRITAPVAPAMAALLAAMVIDPRLLALAERRERGTHGC
jgi:hypothetical protein